MLRGENWGGMVLAEIAFVIAGVALVRMAGRRWFPLLVPDTRKATLAGGLGGAAGGYILGQFWPLWPVGHGFSPPWVLAGVATGILVAGLMPFLKILFRL